MDYCEHKDLNRDADVLCHDCEWKHEIEAHAHRKRKAHDEHHDLEYPKLLIKVNAEFVPASYEGGIDPEEQDKSERIP